MLKIIKLKVLMIYKLLWNLFLATNDFDMYIFSRSWVPGFCYFNKEKCEDHYPSKFIIHGLWPTWKNGSWPQYCKNNKTNYNELKTIITDLNYHWSDNNQPQWDLWQHEWSKHGTCAVNNSYINNTYQYFTTVLWMDLRLNANYYINTTIIPSNTIPHKKSFLRNLFTSDLVCKKDKNKSILVELRNTVNKGLNNVSYSNNNLNCDPEVYLLDN